MELTLLIGLQAAGKTTFYRQRLADGYTHISMDLLRNNPHLTRRQAQLIEQALQAGQPVVIDNTSPTVEVRAPLIALGKQYGYTIIGYYFLPDVAASLKRNAGREGKAKVPPVAIYATRKKLQPPSYAEGFAQLYSVRIVEDGAFRVEPWVAEATDA
ncbi:MAG TPA: ATP-binding protein [Ktedonobacterales bacterium]|jgi:predicted kinase